jgi:hypothetical protein
MKRLPGVRETNLPLNAVSLDLRSPAGKTSEGYFRLIVNAISERDGRLRRLGGWRALSLTNATGHQRINEDLHDQLITNSVHIISRVDLPSYPVIGWGFSSYSPGATTVPNVTIPVTPPDATAYNAVSTDVQMPTISIVPPVTRVYVPYVGYQWRTSVKVTANIYAPTRGYVDLQFNSTKAGGTAISRFETVLGANLALNDNVYVYGCAPDDATQWTDTGSSSLVMLWSFSAQDNILVQPFNTMVICP